MQIVVNTTGMTSDQIFDNIMEYLDRHGLDAVGMRYRVPDRFDGCFAGLSGVQDATLPLGMIVVDTAPRNTTA